MAVYHVIHRVDSGDVVAAVIQDGVVTGTEAEMVKAALAEEDWEPGTDPRIILNGSYLFAVLVEDSNG